MLTAPRVSLVTGAPPVRFEDCRREVRTVCKGEVHIVAENGEESFIIGEVVDVSSMGFRAVYRNPFLVVGTQVRFRHKFFQGRAQVMWSNPMANSIQSGFQIVRDA